jgi:hypothetical protein
MSRAIPPLPQYAFMAWCSTLPLPHAESSTYSLRPLKGGTAHRNASTYTEQDNTEITKRGKVLPVLF